MTAGSIPDSVKEVSYLVVLMQDTRGGGPQLKSLIVDRTYHLGESLEIRASLMDAGKPVDNAQVQAVVATMNGERTRLKLSDDGRQPDALAGDGIFSARVPAFRKPGDYVVSISASRSGVHGKFDFKRTTGEQLVVSRSRSHVNGRFRDFCRDTNGDGLFDELVIEVGVSVTDRATLGLRGMLFDRKGQLLDGGALPRSVDPGERMLEIRYPTELLYRSGEPGPFLLDTLRLYEMEEAWIAPLEVRSHAYRTKAYPRDAFRHEQILLNGQVMARGVDKNANGLFEVLVIELGVDIDYAGDYGWNVLLGSGDDLDAGFVQGSGNCELRKGSNTLHFEFPGACISRMPDRGGYVLASLYLGLGHIGPTPKGGAEICVHGPVDPDP